MHDRGFSRKFRSAQTSAVLPLLAVVASNIALAFGPVFVRQVDVGPVAAGFWRIAFAIPMLMLLARATSPRPFAGAGALWPAILLGGVAFAIDLGTWHLGILRTSLANATLFGNCAVLMFPIYGFFVARAWPSKQQGLALLLAAAGAALLLGRSYQLSPKNFAGDMLCLLAGVFYTFYFIVMARVRARLPAIATLALTSLATALPMLLAARLLGETIWPHHWLLLIAFALSSQVIGQGLTVYAIGHLSPLVIGIALLIQPVVAATVGWLAYGESLGTADFIGAFLVAIALVLVRAEGPKVAPDAEEATSA